VEDPPCEERKQEDSSGKSPEETFHLKKKWEGGVERWEKKNHGGLRGKVEKRCRFQKLRTEKRKERALRG